MAASDKSRPPRAVPLDLLPVIRRSGVLTDRQFQEIRLRIARGEMPSDPIALAEHLVRETILTQYQAQRFLAGKSHGLSVGRYIILDRLGSGSMGRVYKAQHQLMGRVVALKIIAPGIVTNERVVARFQREMRLVGRLDHPNVVRAYDADKIENVLFIVMEYVRGHSLTQIVRARGPLPPADLINYATQSALGLAHAHRQGVIHRDIKPSNLLINESKQVKILDLGLGVLTDSESQGTFMTAENVTVGTVDYMSPEQACARELDGRSDLFSLGCTMYHVLTGRLPFPGDSQIERLGKRLNGSPVPLAEIMPGLPPRLLQAMDRLLANQPEDRFQSAEEAAEAFQAITRKRPPRPGPTPKVSTHSSSVDGEHAPEARPPTAPPEDVLPAWLLPLADLAGRAPNAALLVVLASAAIVFGLGLIVGWRLI